MSMSTSVVGFKPPDEKWKAMKAVYDACIAGKVRVPDEVQKFFNWCGPTEAGVVVELLKTDCVKAHHTDSESGFDVDVTKLPKDVTLVRFYNSW